VSEPITAAWDEVAWALGVPLPRAERDALIARYREPHRRYHDVSHIEACLAHLDELRGLAKRPAEVGCAILFHDAIYEPGRTGDEARSAELARSVLAAAGADPAAIDRIAAMIEATAGHAPTDDPDRALLLDIDLAILAAAPVLFDRYEDAVRAEHAMIDDADFARGRAAFVAAMLARPAIYLRSETHARWEQRARANLARSAARWR
jgi:predicted metal-dependent HD superfamily phosphohydrolase